MNFELKEVSDSTPEKRNEKLRIAKEATLPVIKLIGTVSNDELRGRLEATWTNTGVLSAFVAAIAVSFLFADLQIDSQSSNIALMKNVRSSFYAISAIATMLLILAVALTVINLISLLVCPLDYVDDLLVRLGSMEGVPSILMIISIVSIVAIVPMFIFVEFGYGTEFVVCFIVSIGTIVCGLGYNAFMMNMQHTILNKSLAASK